MHDRGAYDELYRAERDTLVRLATRLLGNAADAEAFVHDAFTKALEEWDTVGGYARPGAWVRHVMIRKIIDEQRRQQTRRDREPELVIDLRTTADLRSSAVGPIEDLYTAELLSTLPPPAAQAVYLTGVLGYTSGEAAEILGSTPAAVRLRAFRGRKALQKHLGLAAKVLGAVPIPAGIGAQAHAALGHLTGAVGSAAGLATASGAGGSASSAAGGHHAAPAPKSRSAQGNDQNRRVGPVAAAAAIPLAGATASAAGESPGQMQSSTAGATSSAGAVAAQFAAVSGAGTGGAAAASPAGGQSPRRKAAAAALILAVVAVTAVFAAGVDATPSTQANGEAAGARSPHAAGRQATRPQPTSDTSPDQPGDVATPSTDDVPAPAGDPSDNTTDSTSVATTTRGGSIGPTGPSGSSNPQGLATTSAPSGPAATIPNNPVVTSTASTAPTTASPTTAPTAPRTRQLVITVSSNSGPLPAIGIVVRCAACDDQRVATTTDASGNAQVTLAADATAWPAATIVSIYPNAQTGAGPFGQTTLAVGAEATTSIAFSPGVPSGVAVRWYSPLPVPTYVTDSIDTVIHGVVETPIGASQHVQRTETTCTAAPTFGMSLGATELVRCLGIPTVGVAFRSPGTTLWSGSTSSIRVPESPALIAVETSTGPLRIRSASGVITYSDGTMSSSDGTIFEP